ncbi:putative component of NuA3 histone acetyltransferase complex, partial [Linderina pennispora]
LSDSDRVVLQKYMNSDYLGNEIMAQVADKFADDSSIQLAHFLNSATANSLAELLARIDEHDGMMGSHIPPHGTGERNQWHAVGSPVVRRYMRLNAPATANTPESTEPTDDGAVTDIEDEASRLLAAVQEELFDSGAFARWLNRITTLALTARRGMVRRFRSGLDYTLGTPDGSTGVMLDATLALAASQEKWADGVIGGYQCYVDGGDGDEASNDGSVYRRTEEDGILLTTPAAWNTLNLVMREPSVVKFIKYVSAASPGSRWDVAFEYKVQDDDDE